MAAAHTTNLNLNKPDREDFVRVVNDINDNMDIIDSKIGAVPSNKNVQGQIDSLSDQIGTQWDIESSVEVTYGEHAGGIGAAGGFDNVYAIKYKNGMKRIKGCLAITAQITGAETLFSVPSAYAVDQTKNHGQIWKTLSMNNGGGSYSVICSSENFSLWTSVFPNVGNAAIDWWYL